MSVDRNDRRDTSVGRNGELDDSLSSESSSNHPPPRNRRTKTRRWTVPMVVRPSEERRREDGPVARFLVSFPRSGHHMVERMLRAICRAHDYPYSYCEYYSCCKRQPCAENAVLQKNHDFDLNFDPDMGRSVVLYRSDPIVQLDAWYRWRVGRRSGEYQEVLEPDPGWWKTRAHLDGLTRFATRHARYYRRFVAKWVEANPENIVAIEYGSFLNSPEDFMFRILAHLFPDLSFDARVIADAVRIENPSPRKQMPAEFYGAARERLGDVLGVRSDQAFV